MGLQRDGKHENCGERTKRMQQSAPALAISCFFGLVAPCHVPLTLDQPTSQHHPRFRGDFKADQPGMAVARPSRGAQSGCSISMSAVQVEGHFALAVIGGSRDQGSARMGKIAGAACHRIFEIFVGTRIGVGWFRQADDRRCDK